MRFKVDENLPVEVADFLRQHQHDALTVIDQQLGGHPDQELARVCLTERRAIVTLDLDFSDIRLYRPEDHQGIIVLRPAFPDDSGGPPTDDRCDLVATQCAARRASLDCR